MPVAATVKVAVWPVVTVWLAGWVVIEGATGAAAAGAFALVRPEQPERPVIARIAAKTAGDIDQLQEREYLVLARKFTCPLLFRIESPELEAASEVRLGELADVVAPSYPQLLYSDPRLD